MCTTQRLRRSQGENKARRAPATISMGTNHHSLGKEDRSKRGRKRAANCHKLRERVIEQVVITTGSRKEKRKSKGKKKKNFNVKKRYPKAGHHQYGKSNILKSSIWGCFQKKKGGGI